MGMRRLARKGMVVALAAGFATVLAATAGAQSTGIATRTTLETATQQIGGRAVTTYSATVVDEKGAPVKGAVTLVEGNRSLAGAALDAEGKAAIRFDGLAAGEHTLSAVYAGDSTHATSQSANVVVHPEAVAADTFALSVAPTSLSVSAPGGAASLVATITSGTNFTGFVSLSCAGAPVSPGSYTDTALPVGVSCTFTPANLQVTSAIANSANPTLTSDLTIQTTAPAGANGLNRVPRGIPGSDKGSPLVLAVLLPGVVGLGFLGRKRNLFGRVALVLMIGAIGVLGTTACNARYRYLNHPPTANEGTPSGAYTLTIWAQTSNGVTASEQFTTIALNVGN
jgi:hypothetical protein